MMGFRKRESFLILNIDVIFEIPRLSYSYRNKEEFHA